MQLGMGGFEVQNFRGHEGGKYLEVQHIQQSL